MVISAAHDQDGLQDVLVLGERRKEKKEEVRQTNNAGLLPRALEVTATRIKLNPVLPAVAQMSLPGVRHNQK